MTTKIALTNIADTALATLTGPKITTIVYPGTETATDTAGGETINLTGNGFQSGCSVLVGSTAASVVTFISTTQISFVAPAMSANTYVIYVINPDGGTAISIPGISYSGTPNWTTAAGSLGTAYETGSISTILTATGDAPITYTLASGTLPTGSTLSTGGSLSGTAVATASITTYNFTITAKDTQNQTTNRSFSLTINPDVVAWSSPASLTTYSVFKDVAIANVTMSASSAAGGSITYTADTLPTGLSITGANIAGTPTVAASTTTVLTATATSTRTATRTINWVVSVANDTYWKNTTLLLNGETTVTPFISDASTNSLGLTIVGDTKPVLFNPYQGDGYYSNYFNGTTDYLSIASNAGFAFGTGDFTIEFWVYPTATSAQYWFDLNDATNRLLIFYAGVNIIYYFNPGGSTLISGSAPIFNAWNHIALSRVSGSTKLFLNGAQTGSTYADTKSYIAMPLTIGKDFAAATYITGYMSNVRVLKGTGLYSNNFTPSTVPLTAVTNTSLLTCQSNRFIDKSIINSTISTSGTPTVSPAIPFTQNSSYSTYGSAYFDGTGDYLTVPNNTALDFGSSDFTIEFWVYRSGTGDFMPIEKTISGQYGSWYLQLTGSTNTLAWYCSSTGSSADMFNNVTVGTIPLYSWTHVAIVRSGSTFTGYINGVGTSLGTSSATIFNSSYVITLGAHNGSSSFYLNGYISNARIVKGTAVYTSAFTPPTAPLTAIANTSLLTLQYNGGANNSGIIDNSNFNNIITRAGNTSQGTFSPYSQTGWSNYFNGTTDYISGISSAASPSGTGSWTIECWFYQTARSSGTGRLVDGDVQWTTAVLSTGEIYAETSNGAGSKSVTGTVVTLNTWHHMALVKNSSTVTLYYDGVAQGSSWTESLSLSAVAMNIAGKASGTTTRFLGYISNARIVNGTAVYTSAFTPPTSPLTAITNTSLLTCQSNRFIDNSPNNASLTINGTPNVQAYSPFGSISEATPLSYSISSVNGSNYVDVSSSSNIAFGSGDYTMEWYTYLTTDQSHSPYMWDFRSAGGAGTQYAYFGSATGLITNYGTFTIPSILNTWRHWAITRAGTTWRLFIDGTQISSSTDSSTYTSSGTYRFGLRYAVESASLIGLVSNLRFVKGQALYTGSFTPSTTPLTKTTVGSTGAGAAGSLTGTVVVLTLNSTTIVDSSTIPATITSSGVIPNKNNPFGYTAQSATSYTPTIHGGSAYFDGSGDYLNLANSTTWSSLPSDFTIECWFYFMNSTQQQQVLFTQRSSSNQYVPYLFWTSNATIVMYSSSNNSGWDIINGTTVVSSWTPQTWNHFAFTRSGSTNRTFFNGVQTYTYTNSSSFTNSGTFNLGMSPGETNTATYGYVTDARLTKTAIYTSNFVPPAQTLTNYSTTYPASLLLNFNNGGIVDQHSSNVLETVGNAQLSTAVKKYNVASMYFNGSSDLYLPSSNNFAFSTGDFTIECWMYPTSISATASYIFDQRTADSQAVLLVYILPSTGPIEIYVSGGVIISGGTVTLNTWSHFAITRASNSLKMFLNGTQIGSTYTLSASLITAPMYIGTRYNGTQYFNGYIDDFRITKGYARYTANFTAPTSALITK